MTFGSENSPFDAETRALLPDFLVRLPTPVEIRVWADPSASTGEREAARLARGLAAEFEMIQYSLRPQRINYAYYPVIGILGIEDGEETDYGLRIIGLPAGMQLTSLIAAIQAVSFKGNTLEPKTRIKLGSLQRPVELELLSAADDELGTMLSKTVFGLAASSPQVRSYLIMADVFPEVLWRYSVQQLPHLVINGHYHVDTEFDEDGILRHIGHATQS